MLDFGKIENGLRVELELKTGGLKDLEECKENEHGDKDDEGLLHSSLKIDRISQIEDRDSKFEDDFNNITVYFQCKGLPQLENIPVPFSENANGLNMKHHLSKLLKSETLHDNIKLFYCSDSKIYGTELKNESQIKMDNLQSKTVMLKVEISHYLVKFG